MLFHTLGFGHIFKEYFHFFDHPRFSSDGTSAFDANFNASTHLKSKKRKLVKNESLSLKSDVSSQSTNLKMIKTFFK